MGREKEMSFEKNWPMRGFKPKYIIPEPCMSRSVFCHKKRVFP
jgi:hypothetical protein